MGNIVNGIATPALLVSSPIERLRRRSDIPRADGQKEAPGVPGL